MTYKQRLINDLIEFDHNIDFFLESYLEDKNQHTLFKLIWELKNKIKYIERKTMSLQINELSISNYRTLLNIRRDCKNIIEMLENISKVEKFLDESDTGSFR